MKSQPQNPEFRDNRDYDHLSSMYAYLSKNAET